MLARIAHELFWLGRNLGRAEHTARMLDGVLLGDLQGRPEAPEGITLGWGGLLAIMGAPHTGEPLLREDVLHALTSDRDNPGSVVSCVARAREGARTVRDVISAEMWESINTTNLALEGGVMPLPRTYVRERCALFWGLAARTMLRDEASAFLSAGGRTESADMILRMLRVALPPTGQGDVEGGQALALLHAVGGWQAYRRAVPGPPNALPVARFLLYEVAFPDSVAASVEATRNVLHRADANPRTSEPILRLSRLGADLEFQARTDGGGPDLSATCESVQQELARVDADIAERYFAGAASPGVVTSSA